MKKILLLTAFAILSVGAEASQYDYLTFQQTDGTMTSVASVGTTITFSDGNANITNGETATTLSLSSLDKMYFAVTSGVIDVNTPAEGQIVAYDLTGKEVGTFRNMEELRSKLTKGVYIIKVNGKTKKIAIK